MRVAQFLAGSILCWSISSGLAVSQTETIPADIPPTSFKGRQFVDSQGCVFLRAGIDGSIYWVPRMNTARQPICGQTPTEFEGQVSRTETVAPEVPVIDVKPTVPNIVTDVDVERPTPDKVDVERADIQVAKVKVPEPDEPVIVHQDELVIVEQTAIPDQIIEIVEVPVPVSKVEVPVPVSKPALKPKSNPRRQPKIANQERQVEVTRTKAATSAKVERVIPKHVAINRQNAQALIVPKGYTRVWEDDRLNPKRTEQTVAGHRKMNLIWTATVPRRLINQVTGEDMTQKLALVYPYTDKATQRREFGKVTLEHRDGKVIKRVKRRVAKTKTTAVNQTKPVPLSAARYVQVGAFANPENANRAAHLLKGNGLTVRLVRAGPSGKPLKLVLAGPFQSDLDAREAVKTAQTVGFHDAFIRK
ncbi:SPOR domain-containing protein [Pseudophaeobacter sp.]|uniref:SPOR domain-containing protein n=1 Tax=Pseudophaeobacter sp. TaxID=1971739 RepID=UPI003298B05C